MKSKPVRLRPIETLLKIIFQKLGKKCKDEDILKAREKSIEKNQWKQSSKGFLKE